METPVNFLRNLRPDTVTEAVDQNPIGQLKLIAKAALMQYIASYFDERGANRALLKHSAPGLASMYDAGHGALSESNLYRKLQVARLFESTKAELPSILITDAGARNIPVGLGSYDQASVDQNTGKAILRTTSAIRISLNLFVGAEDLATADAICTALGLIFSTALRRLGGGDMITNEQYGREHTGSFTPGTWVMHLPQGEIDIPAASHNPHGEDQKAGFYTATTSISDVYLEASSYYAYDHRLRPEPGDIRSSDSDNLNETFAVQIEDIPPIPLGRSQRIVVRYLPVGGQLYVADRNIATIRNGVELVAKSVGTTTLRVLAPGADKSRVLVEKPVTVVWR